MTTKNTILRIFKKMPFVRDVDSMVEYFNDLRGDKFTAATELIPDISIPIFHEMARGAIKSYFKKKKRLGGK